MSTSFHHTRHASQGTLSLPLQIPSNRHLTLFLIVQNIVPRRPKCTTCTQYLLIIHHAYDCQTAYSQWFSATFLSSTDAHFTHTNIQDWPRSPPNDNTRKSTQRPQRYKLRHFPRYIDSETLWLLTSPVTSFTANDTRSYKGTGTQRS